MSQWKFWVDRGGTFTDIVAKTPEGELRVHKLMSVDPKHYKDAGIAAIRYFLKLNDSDPIPKDQIHSIRMGTTVATNALLERKGDRTILLTSHGFKDALRLAYQQRPHLFDLNIQLPEMLYESVIETTERVDVEGQDIQALDLAAVRVQLQAAYDDGIRSMAIVFMHSYLFPEHELAVAEIAKDIGYTQISMSHDVSPLIKLVGRGDTTVVDAYLSPILKRYVDYLKQELSGVKLEFMKSSGGLIDANFFRAKDSILSGPAGGVVGAAKVCVAAGFENVIGFDMGGTSTDVMHYQGEFERSYEKEVAGARMRVPMMAIHTIAAGGGSIVRFHQGRLQVGPESAGSEPGPACYRKGGPLAITDCNVLLGKVNPDYFPRVFGDESNLPLDRDVVVEKFETLTREINQESGQSYSAFEIAEGFLKIAVDNMANAIKKISIQKGRDISDAVLCSFGGAGSQHACLVAESLGLKKILLHPFAGVLSAYGIGLSDVNVMREMSVNLAFNELQESEKDFHKLEMAAHEELNQQGLNSVDCDLVRKVYLKYAGTDATVGLGYQTDLSALKAEFEHYYQSTFGFTMHDKPILVDMISLELIAKVGEPLQTIHAESVALPGNKAQFYSHGKMHEATVYGRDVIQEGDCIKGPAMIIEHTSTIIVEPDWEANCLPGGELLMSHHAKTVMDDQDDLQKPDPIVLEIFNNLVMSIAEDMGEALANTAYSVNIKERRDYSCAIFSKQGELIANAPHIPVHLGSMSASIQSVMQEDLKPGDVYVLNDPYHGGTHLPDVTVVTPVFIAGEIEFYVGTRGHHADIGGITPGSMPSNSVHIDEEGVLFTNFKLIDQGRFLEDEFLAKLKTAKYPARNVDQNLSDIKAQVAANQKGIQEIQKMVAHFGLKKVQAYMQFVQDNAELAVRNALRQLQSGECKINLDNGASIQTKITVSGDTAVVDFTGSSEQGDHNFNAPKAITIAAILYVFRCLVHENIPLNQGCLKPIKIIVPEGSLLNPSYPHAVVAGNVETSQNIVDSLLSAMGVLAQSQGTMNNLTFGNARYQYYETIAGGMGAGDGFDGASAVQCHMTNSRLTDPEVLEQRFPVLLQEFRLRKNSGGQGRFVGGDGVVRQIQFLEPMEANILSLRRLISPKGLLGGGEALMGRNAVLRSDGSIEELSGCDSVQLNAGDSLLIETPGGGGFNS